MPCIHITDVGTTEHAGVDSLVRIKKQYLRLGYMSDIIPAGHSPLHVAFTALTDLSAQAQHIATQIKDTLLHSQTTILPTNKPTIALNCAPRNSTKQVDAAQEHHIFRIRTSTATYILYGPEVFEWVINLLDPTEQIHCDRVMAIPPYIPDTSCGSQFRSGEYLPIAHILELSGLLDTYGVFEPITNLHTTSRTHALTENTAIVAPPDEYGNSRLLIHASTWNSILHETTHVHIPDLYHGPVTICKSLTSVIPDAISVWQSSNSFPNPNIVVINLGTRWKPGTTQTTHASTKEIAQLTNVQVGKVIDITS
jgi:hypothetical protein